MHTHLRPLLFRRQRKVASSIQSHLLAYLHTASEVRDLALGYSTMHWFTIYQEILDPLRQRSGNS